MPTPSPAPSDKMLALNRLVGSWHVGSPAGKSQLSGQVTFRWLEGRFFLLQEIDLLHDGRPIKGLEIIGHEHRFGEEPGAEIKSRYYGADGSTLDYVYELAGDTLTIWGGERGSPAYYQGTFSADGNPNAGAWVYLGGGYESRMSRVGA